MLLLLLAVQGPASATTASRVAGAVDQAPEQVAESVQPATGETGPAAGVAPTTAVRPRSLRTYWHVFGAFGLTWVLLLGYVVSLGRRFGRLEREVRTLRHPGG